jgi:hypothetical protein
MDTPFPNLSTETFDQLAVPAQTTQMGDAREPCAVPQSLLQAFALSLELCPQVITNLVSRALQSMDRRLASFNGEHTAVTVAMEAAAVALDEQRRGWAQQYPPLLRMAIAYPCPAKLAAIMPTVDLRICVQETVQLDALVTAHGSLRPNPLSPLAFVQALLELVNRSTAHPELKKIWAEHMLAALSSQLAWVYLQLQAVVRDPSSRETSAPFHADGFHDIAAIAFGFAHNHGDIGAQDEGQDIGLDTQAQQLAEQARLTVLRLRKHLGVSEEQGDALELAVSANPMDELLKDLDESEQLMAQIRERGLPMPSLDDSFDAFNASTQTQLLPMPTSPSPFVMQEISIAQVTELIKSYQNTTSPALARVPVPLQEALEDLKLPLFALAQADAAVLTDDQHPAQKFLALITQRSLRYASEMAEGYTAFMLPVDKLITAFSAMRPPSSKGFDQACTSLSTVWQRQDDAAAREFAAKNLQEEQMLISKQLAGRLGFQLVGRKDASEAPPMMKQFLMGPWAQVMATAQLFPQREGDTERYSQALSALLWSVSLRRAAPRKAEHAALIPQLMPQLKAGLLSIPMPEVQVDALLSDIKKLQEAVQASVVAADADMSLSDPAPLLA